MMAEGTAFLRGVALLERSTAKFAGGKVNMDLGGFLLANIISPPIVDAHLLMVAQRHIVVIGVHVSRVPEGRLVTPLTVIPNQVRLGFVHQFLDGGNHIILDVIPDRYLAG